MAENITLNFNLDVEQHTILRIVAGESGKSIEDLIKAGIDDVIMHFDNHHWGLDQKSAIPDLLKNCPKINWEYKIVQECTDVIEVVQTAGDVQKTIMINRSQQ